MVAESAALFMVGESTAVQVDYPRLLRLCTRLLGDADAAEDAAQDTLVEAWRHRHKLQQPAGWDAWLAAIARHVCRRRQAKQQHDRDHLLLPRAGEYSGITEVADSTNLEGDLERAQLAELVARGLALLPAATRDVLVERYVHSTPQALVAARLGLSESAVEARLYRGKQALRSAFSATLYREASSYDLVQPGAWQATRLWCPLCGTRRLVGRFEPNQGLFSLRCPTCYPSTGIYCAYEAPELFCNIRGYKPALGRVMRWANAYYRPALSRGFAACPGCGRDLPLRREQAPQVAAALHDPRAVPGVHVHCPRCGQACSMRLSNLILYLPHAWQFWRLLPRLQILPFQTVEVDGRSALLARLQSKTGAACLDVVVARDSYELIAVHTGPGQ